ncbi:type I restriction-modification system subunit M N-terminal domain-containing protein, partial [Vibrio parahaemolyticus]|nr:type I restriction-modification system subunit M N-terminal domain-containing protein [Vibrio parahaemolyticus]NMV27386.1 type I restriction-modification system subunit M N-terminal domain-containing protein [Vibrio parahaemolyticus]
MNTPINQSEINKAVWNACDTFRGTVDPSIYKDFILTMLFLKYISDVHQDKVDELKKEFGDIPELIAEMLESQSFKIPPGSSFWDLYEARFEAGN